MPERVAAIRMDDTDDEAPRPSSIAGSPPGDESLWTAEEFAVVRSSLTIDYAATAKNIAAMRRVFAAWLAVDVRAGDLLNDLVLVVYEALANAVDHAYVDRPGDIGAVRLTARRATIAYASPSPTTAAGVPSPICPSATAVSP